MEGTVSDADGKHGYVWSRVRHAHRFGEDLCGTQQIEHAAGVRMFRGDHQDLRILIFAVPVATVVLNWLWALPLPLAVKIAGGLVILGASQFQFWSRLSSGSMLVPEMPRPLIMAFNWAFGTLMFLTLFQFALDLGALLVALIAWRPPYVGVWPRFIIGVLSASLSTIGLINALRVPPVTDVDVPVQGLPQSFDGYRLLQLTDLHLTRLFPADWARAVVERANASGADLIVVTGDFIDGSVEMRQDDVAPLAELAAPDGVLGIPGNHEYFFDYPEWMAHLRGLGIDMIENGYIVLTRGGDHLVIAGVTDRSAESRGFAKPDLDAALVGSPMGAPVVLLDHQPRDARSAAARGVALQLSGHTHGGMILGLDRIVARANNGFVSGRYDVDGMMLYVSNGTGLWPGFALRLCVPPEMTRFRLRKA